MKDQIRSMRECLEIIGPRVNVDKIIMDDQYWTALLNLVRNARELVALEIESEALINLAFNESGEEWIGKRRQKGV